MFSDGGAISLHYGAAGSCTSCRRGAHDHPLGKLPLGDLAKLPLAKLARCASGDFEGPGAAVEDFVKLIGRTDSKDSIELTSTEEDALLLRLMNGYKREFKIHLIESTSGTAPLPKLDFDASISMSKSVFEKVLGDISVVADQVAISALKEGVWFGGKSDIGAATIQLDKNGADVLEMDVKAEAKASYNIDYFASISRALGSTAETVMLQFSSKKPAKLTFKLNEQGAVVSYFLAPRIQES